MPDLRPKTQRTQDTGQWLGETDDSESLRT